MIGRIPVDLGRETDSSKDGEAEIRKTLKTLERRMREIIQLSLDILAGLPQLNGLSLGEKLFRLERFVRDFDYLRTSIFPLVGVVISTQDQIVREFESPEKNISQEELVCSIEKNLALLLNGLVDEKWWEAWAFLRIHLSRYRRMLEKPSGHDSSMSLEELKKRIGQIRDSKPDEYLQSAMSELLEEISFYRAPNYSV